MSDRKHIDDLFRDGVSGMSVSPDPKTKDEIAAAYYAVKGSSVKWYYYSAAVVLLFIAGLTGWYLLPESGKLSEQDLNSRIENSVEDVREVEILESVSPTTEAKIESSDVNTSTTRKLQIDSEKASVHDYEMKDKSSNAVQKNKTVSFNKQVAEMSEDLQAEKLNSNQSFSMYKDITYLPSLGMPRNQESEPFIIDPDKVTGLKAFLDKKKKSHFYTGISATVGMTYYPSTKDQFSWSANAVFGLTAGKFYFESGIGYQEMKEEGIYSIEFKSYDSIGYYNEVQSFEINPLDSDDIIYKTEEVTVYDSISHYNHATPTFKYNYLNVPIIFGYKVYEKKNIIVGIETGVLFSFLIYKEVPEVDFNYPENTNVKTINQTPERVELNYSWQLAVHLNYRFSKSMSISVKPIFTKFLNSVYDTDKGYQNVKPYSMGMQVGLYYGF